MEVGKFLLKRLQTEARQSEVDKFKLQLEETDKIRSLLLGLASRLARSEIALINLKKNWNEDEEVSSSLHHTQRLLTTNKHNELFADVNYFFAPVSTWDNVFLYLQGALKNKREKLLDQLSEAKSLMASIEKRGAMVSSMLGQYFTQAEYEQFSTHMKTRAMLLLQNKMLAERLSLTQQQLDGVLLHKC